MRKTIIYIVLLAVLGLGVYYFLFSNKNVFGVDEAGFTVEDTAAVYKIFLADKSGNMIKLERKEKGWVVNDTMPAIEATVNSLLKTMHQQQAMYPVAENTHNMVVKILATKGIKVELYDKKDDLMKVFYVGGQVGSISGTQMLIEGAKRPYVVQVPGFEGYLTPRYSVDIKDWRDRTVFDVAQGDLKSVSIQYPDQPLNNFTLSQDEKGNISVAANPELMKQPFNERRAKVYTGFFEKVYSEGYLNGSTDLGSIIAAAPKKCALDIASKSGQTYHVDIYWMPVGKRSKNLDVHDPDVPDGYDADRYYAVANNFKDTLVIQRYTFNKLFRKGYEFFSADDKEPMLTPDDTIRRHNVVLPVAN
jgi:hypothetical protein